jgi:hypothetical protein
MLHFVTNNSFAYHSEQIERIYKLRRRISHDVQEHIRISDADLREAIGARLFLCAVALDMERFRSASALMNAPFDSLGARLIRARRRSRATPFIGMEKSQRPRRRKKTPPKLKVVQGARRQRGRAERN